MKLTLLMGIEKNNFLPFAVYLRNVDKEKWMRMKLFVFSAMTHLKSWMNMMKNVL